MGHVSDTTSTPRGESRDVSSETPGERPRFPQWLTRSFTDAVHACGGTSDATAIDAAATKLLNAWCAHTRTCHNAGYLASLITHLDELVDAAHDPEVLVLAAWCAGVVPHTMIDGEDDIDRQCQRLRDVLTGILAGLDIDEEVTQRVLTLVHDLHHHTAPRGDVDADVLLDADFAVMAAIPQEYKRYRLAIRGEYPHLKDAQFAVARFRFIRALLARDVLFRSPLATALWEVSARQNLEAELALLEPTVREVNPEVLDEPTEMHEPVMSSPSRAISIPGVKVSRVVSAREEDTAVVKTGALPTLTPGNDTEDHPQEVASSSLEAEPDYLMPAPQVRPRRLTAKEAARDGAATVSASTASENTRR